MTIQMSLETAFLFIRETQFTRVMSQISITKAITLQSVNGAENTTLRRMERMVVYRY